MVPFPDVNVSVEGREHKEIVKEVEMSYNMTRDWLTGNELMKVKYCEMKKLSCPKACGECKKDETATQTSKCADRSKFHFSVGSDGNVTNRNIGLMVQV